MLSKERIHEIFKGTEDDIIKYHDNDRERECTRLNFVDFNMLDKTHTHLVYLLDDDRLAFAYKKCLEELEEAVVWNGEHSLIVTRIQESLRKYLLQPATSALGSLVFDEVFDEREFMDYMGYKYVQVIKYVIRYKNDYLNKWDGFANGSFKADRPANGLYFDTRDEAEKIMKIILDCMDVEKEYVRVEECKVTVQVSKEG